ncbi:MAG TPA: S8 family serine peptidase [Thermoanaerobaculia bacterium]|nr:S8 family serine peptidase [Thermoanaerobaculia bacterium]
MARQSKGSAGNVTRFAADVGSADFIVLNGQRLELIEHPTDFSMIGPSRALESAVEDGEAGVRPLSRGISRVRAEDAQNRDALMDTVRQENVAHHIYQVAATGEEIAIDNRILLTLRHDDPQLLEEIIEEFKLVTEGRMGDAYVLRVTEATGRNPLRTANAIEQKDGVASCQPQVLIPLEAHQASFAETHRLFRQQWYLSGDLMTHPDVLPDSGIRAPEAWQITLGHPDVVIAVIDDGFDLSHPAFRNKRIHSAARDFAVNPGDASPLSEGADYHGTCVASIATGALDGDGMVGVAPGCTLLPIRIGFGPLAAPVDILEVFRYASRHADVVNCSFGTGPSSFDRFSAAFRQAITDLTRTGGRRGKGLVMVFSAGNDDAPTFLRSTENRNGVFFTQNSGFGMNAVQIPPDSAVFSGYPLTQGIIVAGAMTSLKRKSGYSSWGPHITVTAPSNNMHYITSFIARGVNDQVRDRFVANYRGLGQVAATNRPGNGHAFSPFLDDQATPDFREDHYTGKFGGTSGAAPIISGVAALMLSVNSDLSAAEVKQILMTTADRNLDPRLDLAADPNIQGLSGAFVNGRSPFFGSGKVDALKAVERARSLRGPVVHPSGTPATPERPPLEDVALAAFAMTSQPAWNTTLTARHLRERPGKVIGVVLHDTAGSGRHNDTLYLANPSDGRTVSVDFTVERDGSIWKLNPDLSRNHCLHAGRATAWRGLRNHQVNQATVGIEITQKSDLSLTPLYPVAQVRSVAQLCAWLVTHFGLQASDVTTHQAIITDGSRSDPRRFPFDGQEGFWFFFRQALGQERAFLASLLPESEIPPDFAVRDVVAGEGEFYGDIAM